MLSSETEAIMSRSLRFHEMSLILLVGFSRIALGAHYLSDVLAAMAFGAQRAGAPGPMHVKITGRDFASQLKVEQLPPGAGSSVSGHRERAEISSP